MNTVRWLHKIILIQGAKQPDNTSLIKYYKIINRKLSFTKRRIPMHKTMNTVLQTLSQDSTKNDFRFTDYDCLGFDLDNTVCRYKIGAMIKLEYETLARYLVVEKGYSPKYLMQPIENNMDFMVKGLILDVENGNILRIAADGHIVHGCHGTTELSRSNLIKYYGEKCRWQVTDAFSKDPLHTWNGPFSEKMRTLLDYFDMPAGLVFGRVVDTLDEQNGGPLEKYSIWPDLLDAIQDMFQREHFKLNKGGYFPNIKEQPDSYIHKCSDDLINWFKNLRKHKKVLFLITGSNVDFASHTASMSLGPNWRDLFDIVICFAKKPGFFTADRPFIGLNGYEETGPVNENNLELGGIYTYGNWAGLYKFLHKHSNRENPKVVYIGDNLVQDIYTPAVHTTCDTVAICEELIAEGAYGHEKEHVDQSFLVSSTWGSYFCHRDEEKYTIWHNIIRNHSKICIPSLEFVAKKPLDYEYGHIIYNSC